MEADGVLEGFSKSIEMHGLKYNCLIGKIKINLKQFIKTNNSITIFIQKCNRRRGQ